MPPRRSLAPTASQIASTRIMPSPQPGPQPLRASAAAVTGHSTCTHLLPTSHTMRAWPPPACIATGIAAATNLTGCPATSTSPPRRLRRPASQLPALHPTRLRVRLQRHPAARYRIENRQTLPNPFRAVLASAAHPHPPKASASQGRHPYARWVRQTLTTCALFGSIQGEGPFLRDLRFHALRHEANSRLFESGFGFMDVSDSMRAGARSPLACDRRRFADRPPTAESSRRIRTRNADRPAHRGLKCCGLRRYSGRSGCIGGHWSIRSRDAVRGNRRPPAYRPCPCRALLPGHASP